MWWSRIFLTRGLLNWRSHALLVKKKNLDGSWEKDARFCLDLRLINAKTIRYSRLIPKISDVIDQLQGSVCFSKIDLVSAYHQIPLTPVMADKTAFTVFRASNTDTFVFVLAS
jgi:hypothetical protein